jgi:hypothetical protein
MKDRAAVGAPLVPCQLARVPVGAAHFSVSEGDRRQLLIADIDLDFDFAVLAHTRADGD